MNIWLRILIVSPGLYFCTGLATSAGVVNESSKEISNPPISRARKERSLADTFRESYLNREPTRPFNNCRASTEEVLARASQITNSWSPDRNRNGNGNGTYPAPTFNHTAAGAGAGERHGRLEEMRTFFSDINICMVTNIDWTVSVLDHVQKALNISNEPLSLSQSENIQFIQTLIEDELARNNDEDLESMIRFAQSQISQPEMLTLFGNIYRNLDHGGQLKRPEFLIFAYHFNIGVGVVPENSSLYPSYTSLHSQINLNAKQNLIPWAREILKSGVSNSTLQFLRGTGTANAEKSFALFLPQLMEMTYGAIKVSITGPGTDARAGEKMRDAGIERLILFVSSLPSLPQRLQGYYEILVKIKGNNDLVSNGEVTRVAWMVRQDVGKSAFDKGLGILEGFKNELPPSIRRLLFNPQSYVIIESIHYPGYTLYGSSWGNMYLYPGNNYVGGKNQQWKVKGVDSGRYFSFEGVESSKGFYEDGDKKIEASRVSSTDYTMQWQVLPANSNGTSVYLRNRSTRNYLSGGYFGEASSSKTGKRTEPGTFANVYGQNQEWEIIL